MGAWQERTSCGWLERGVARRQSSGSTPPVCVTGECCSTITAVPSTSKRLRIKPHHNSSCLTISGSSSKRAASNSARALSRSTSRLRAAACRSQQLRVVRGMERRPSHQLRPARPNNPGPPGSPKPPILVRPVEQCSDAPDLSVQRQRLQPNTLGSGSAMQHGCVRSGAAGCTDTELGDARSRLTAATA